jgi:iron complex outermembrane recepter protein
MNGDANLSCAIATVSKDSEIGLFQSAAATAPSDARGISDIVVIARRLLSPSRATLVAILMLGTGSTAFAADSGEAAAGDSAVAGGSTESSAVQEIVVTARKREERLEDVPMAISVVTAESLVQQATLSLQDYYATVPGLSITDQGTGRLSVSMRGLNTGNNGNSTVAILIDDVPVGATNTAVINGANFVPQLDPADLQRIEFLKGPQGTLYGASSLGGAMRYVTLAPDLNSTSGHVEADGSAISGGGQGYGVRASANIPVIADTLAVRASIFDRRDPGYVDDPSHGQSDVNSIDVYGAHLAVLYRPVENFSMQLAGLVQHTEGNADGTVDTNYAGQPLDGYYNHDRMPGTGAYSYLYQLYSATLKYDFSSLELSSITGYSSNRSTEDGDLTQAYTSFGIVSPGQGASLPNIWGSRKFTQEIRLSSSPKAQLQWEVGGYYTAESNYRNQQIINANNLDTGAVIATLAVYEFPTTYYENAVFGNLTYNFTSQFNVQVGARESHNWQGYSSSSTGEFYPTPFYVVDQSRDNSFTYLVTPQFRFSDTLMTYARVATGYQPGGPNPPAVPGLTLPSFNPSKTTNYELGVKSELLDRRLSLDAAVFYINWTQIQLLGVLPPLELAYLFNGSKAKSEGVEFATEWRPFENFKVGASAAYTEAELTGNAGNGFQGTAGDGLPYTSKWTASLSFEERFRLSRSIEGFVGGTGAYVGQRWNQFSSTPGELQGILPSYSYGNVRTGIRTDGYTVTAYVKNFTNEHGILNSAQQTGSTATSGLWYTSFITPRTVGVSVSKSF